MGKDLVVYFSRSGTCKKVGEEIATKIGSETLEITDEVNRKGFFGFIRTLKLAGKGEVSNIMPKEIDLSGYEKIIIGTPVWMSTVCNPIRTFLIDYADELPDVAFYCCLGSKGAEDTFRIMQKVCRKDPLATLTMTKKGIKARFEANIQEFIEKI